MDNNLNIGTALDGDFLTRHAAILGMTGSGKTGLGIVLLEEARRKGIPMIVLDPKGDLGNLLLHEPSEFHKWASDEQVASWRDGVLGSGMALSAVQELSRVRARIFTPGATYGTPLAVLDAMTPPEGEEARVEEASTMSSALLAMAGMNPDPMTEEHAFLSNILLHHWSYGQAPGLAHIVGSVMSPPIQFIGALPLDAFLPPRKRQTLGRKINTLLAAPGFKAWLAGHPLDPQALLYDESGAPTCSVMAMAHLSESERMFFTALLMSKLVSWMRKQPGTGGLRALVYLDEAFGFCPPVKNPPTKKPIMTLLKQARAHGLGLIVATQNPVDLDYKAMSNCGTWLVGTLRTKQDRARILEAVGESVGLDKAGADQRLAGLNKREFMLLDAAGRAQEFKSRFALCLLRGPLTRDEIEGLSGPQKIGTVRGHVAAWHNQALDIYSRPGEARDEFLARCERAVCDEVDVLYAALLKSYEKPLEKATIILVNHECSVEVQEERFREWAGSQKSEAAVGLLGSLFGHGRRRSPAARKEKSERKLERIRKTRVAMGQAQRSVDSLKKELDEEIWEINRQAHERALDIVEVKS